MPSGPSQTGRWKAAWRTQAPITSLPFVTREPVERLDAVDVDEMGGLGEPERHGRDEALAAGEHASVLRGDFGEQRHRLIDGFRRVVAERRRLHRLVVQF